MNYEDLTALVQTLADESDTLYAALNMYCASWVSEGHLANCEAAKSALDALFAFVISQGDRR